MSKIQRYQGDVRAFASAQQSGERYIFGDATTESDSLSDQLTPDYLRGWAVISASDEPPLEWFNAVAFTATQFIAYLHQSGIPEWNGEQEYHDGSQANFNGQIYTCLTDNHTSVTTPNTDPTNWKKASAGDADNADKLDGQHGSFYRDASNLNTGTVPTARLPEATATSKGVSRQATAQEVEGKVDVDAYVKPSLLPDSFDINGLPQKTTLVDDDEFGISDSEDNTENKKVDFYTIAKSLGLAGSYGVTWNSTSDTYQRVGQTDVTSIQRKMRRCVLNSNGTVNYYLNPNNSNFKEDGSPSDLTGTDGNVMVEIPKFYYRYTVVGDSKTVEISDKPENGFALHPAFIKAGVEVDNRYYRAYEGYYDGTALRSVSGVTPTRSHNINTFRSYAESNGAGWHLTDWQLLHAVQILYLTEFANFNAQAILGNGNSTGSDYGVTTGNSNTLGNNSSSAPNDNWMSYRGIENFYADVWEFIDGINIRDREIWLSNNHDQFSSDSFDGVNYVNTGITAPTADRSYVTDINFGQDGFISTEVSGGSNSTYITDGLWTNSGDRVCQFGGSAYDGALCGCFCLILTSSSAHDDVASGAAVAF